MSTFKDKGYRSRSRSPLGTNLVRQSIHSKSCKISEIDDAGNIPVTLPNQTDVQSLTKICDSSKEDLVEMKCVEQVTINDDDVDDTVERKEPEDDKPVCSVCLDQYVQPIQLPCSHIFCFLCAKGLQRNGGQCALCRKNIPAKVVQKPNLLVIQRSPLASQNTYSWFYEGRGGWWQYDKRTAAEIEDAFLKGEYMCEVMIAGSLYIINFQYYRQLRKDEPFRTRKIKRDLISAFKKKGVAGIKVKEMKQRRKKLN